jgi:UMF1 family MFS transporter
MARIAPPQVYTEMFGLYALAGKATAFMGPALFVWVTALSGSQRIGLSTVLALLLIGALFLLPVREAVPVQE